MFFAFVKQSTGQTSTSRVYLHLMHWSFSVGHGERLKAVKGKRSRRLKSTSRLRPPRILPQVAVIPRHQRGLPSLLPGLIWPTV